MNEFQHLGRGLKEWAELSGFLALPPKQTGSRLSCAHLPKRIRDYIVRTLSETARKMSVLKLVRFSNQFKCTKFHCLDDWMNSVFIRSHHLLQRL